MDTTLIERIERGRRQGRRYVTVAFGVLSGLFILSTTEQLSFAVFGVGAGPLARGANQTEEPNGEGSCGELLRALAAAVDRAISVSARAPDEANASRQYRAALGPEWSDTPSAATSSCQHGRSADALATVVRLRVAGEELAKRHARELAPLRRDVATYLPP
jgi:hypothetical protein